MGTLTPAPRLLGREAELRALDDARARGLQVVTGRAQELERTRPFGVLADALDCTASSPDPRRRAIAALLATQHGDRGPLTVSSDPGLQFQAVDAFADLLESMFVTELVGALRQEGAIQVANGGAEVEVRSGEAGDEVRGGGAEAAGGDGGADGPAVALPSSLRRTILRRLGFLPDDTLQALQAAAILGSSFSLAELSTVMGRSALELAPVLAEAIRSGVLEDDGDHLRFRHDLLREAVYEDLPPSVRQALHHEAGQRLAQSGAPALQVAEQLARGARPGDAEAVTWLTRAAREAASRSPAIAAELLGRAIDLTDPAAPAATSCWWSGPAPSCWPAPSPRPRRPAAPCSTAARIPRPRARPGSPSAGRWSPRVRSPTGSGSCGESRTPLRQQPGAGSRGWLGQHRPGVPG